jgi:phosphotriesterase-related protein
MIMTVLGPVEDAAVGNVLPHEHILVDFIGAAAYSLTRWNHAEVIEKVLPYLQEVRRLGCQTFVDCTPQYVGRDVVLLQRLSRLSGLHIVTNTGFYGGSDPKFLPPEAFIETDRQLAARWVLEWREGIEGSSIYPGLIKISVNGGPLSDISKKLVRAAALTHLQTGLTIASHTGPAVSALEQIGLLQTEGVSPSAFIWVHAQNEKDWSRFSEAAHLGAWVSLDGLDDSAVALYVAMLTHLKEEKCLHRAMISHDAGWYEPGVVGGGTFRGYTTLFQALIPALKEKNFSTGEIRQLTQDNPREAFSVHLLKQSI